VGGVIDCDIMLLLLLLLVCMASRYQIGLIVSSSIASSIVSMLLYYCYRINHLLSSLAVIAQSVCTSVYPSEPRPLAQLLASFSVVYDRCLIVG